MPDLNDTIEDAATEPTKATGDMGSVEMPKLSELIEADRYLASKSATADRRRGLRFTKLVPPGSS